MASPVTIKIDQSGLSAGVAGQSREDLVVGVTFTATDPANPGAGTHLWEYVAPVGETAVPTGLATGTFTVTPTIAGTWRLRKTFTDGGGIAVSGTDQGGAGIKLANGVRIPATGETDEFGDVGWASAMDNTIRNEPFIQGGTSALIRTGQGKLRETVSLDDFVLLPSSAYSGLLAALALLRSLGGGKLKVPGRQYDIDPTSPVVIDFNNLTIEGDGSLSQLRNISATGVDLFQIGSAIVTDARTWFNLRNLRIRSNTGAGHIFTFAPNCGLAFSSWENVYFQQLNVARSIMYRASAGSTQSGLFSCRFTGGFWEHGSGAVWGQATAPTVPSVDLSFANNGLNDVRWTEMRVNNHFGTAPFWSLKDESVPQGAWHYNCAIRDIEVELARRGCIYARGLMGFVVRDVGYYDSDDIDGHLLELASSGTTKSTEQSLVKNVTRMSGDLVGVAGTERSVTGITQTAGVATATTSAAHGYVVGQRIFVSGASQAGYNGRKTIIAVPTTTMFTFAVDAATVTPATGTIQVADAAMDVFCGSKTQRIYFEQYNATSPAGAEIDLNFRPATIIGRTPRVAYYRVDPAATTIIDNATDASVATGHTDVGYTKIVAPRATVPDLANEQGSVRSEGISSRRGALVYDYRDASGVLKQAALAQVDDLQVPIWEPNQLDSLRALYLNTTGAIEVSGANVTRWVDQSGFGNHATATANHPQYVAADPGGAPAVQFIRASSQKLIANWLATYLSPRDENGDAIEDAPCCFFMVLEQTSNDTMQVCDAGSSVTGTPRSGVLATTTTKYGIRRTDDTGATANAGGGTPDTTRHTLVLNSVDGKTYDVWRDGVKIVTAAGCNVGVITADIGYIGASTALTPANFLNGYMRVFGFCTEGLTDAEVAKLNTWMLPISTTGAPPSVGSTRAMPKGGIDGLQISYAAARQISIAAGRCRGSDDLMNLVVAGALTVDLDVSGAGGLDTGAVANTTHYSVWLIGDSTGTNAVKGLASASASAPTMPAGYDRKRRVGWVRTNGSANLLRWNQRGNGRARRYFYDEALSVLNVLTGGSAIAFTDVDLSALVPPGCDMVHLLCGFVAPTVGGAAADALSLRPNGANSSDGPWVFPAGNTLAATMRWTADLPTDVNRIIEYMVTDADDDADIWVLGFEDEL